MFVLGKKEFIGGTIIAIIIFILLGFCLRINQKNIYYQVIFDSNGGTEVAGQNVLFNDYVQEPSTTIREGYLFKGWYIDGKKFNFKGKINNDITLIARWEKIKDKLDNKTQNDNKETSVDEKKSDTPIKESEIKTNDTSSNNNTFVPTTPKQPTNITIDVSSITLNKSNISLRIGESDSLIATILPTNATNQTITWRTSDVTIAEVSNGVVRAKNPGTAIITASSGNKSTTCIITVTRPISYNYEIIDTPSSSIGQCDIYIKSSEGERVSGTIIIHYTNGKDETVAVDANGVRRIRSAISSVTIASVG